MVFVFSLFDVKDILRVVYSFIYWKYSDYMRVMWEKVGSENVFETTVFDYWNGKSTKLLLNKFDENEKK